ncbi:hypothetical protein E3N88_30387 [Mikania micrantha]|uniref:Uncharacterized protein n=1 Tax=Mikania micrantha TaxID=192012 RepID=A0A5N6MLX1_9ASTR|nr:hypothetical protein E3N88_30387 [Mikania micrantha]
MHRSSSSSRVSGDLSDHPSLQNYRTSSDATSEVLPTYNPHSYIATKEQNQIRSAEAAIHLIPLLNSFTLSSFRFDKLKCHLETMKKLIEFGKKAMFYVRVLSGYEERRIRSYRLELQKRITEVSSSPFTGLCATVNSQFSDS